jgi:hypothetical protein
MILDTTSRGNGPPSDLRSACVGTAFHIRNKFSTRSLAHPPQSQPRSDETL